MVEADQLGRPLRGEPDLRSEPGPQPLAAPADLAGQLLDPDLSPAGDDPLPGEGDLRSTGGPASRRRARAASMIANRSSHDRASCSRSVIRATSPPQRSSSATTVALGSTSGPPRARRGRRPATAAPAGTRCRRAPAPAPRPGRAPATALPRWSPTGGVLERRARLVAEVDGHRDGRVAARTRRSTASGATAPEPGHADARQPAAVGDRRCPRPPPRPSPLGRAHVATLRGTRLRRAATFVQDRGHADRIDDAGRHERSPIDPFTPAVELAAAIRRKEVSPVEVADLYLDRIDELDPRLNAFCHPRRRRRPQAPPRPPPTR